MFSQFRHNLFKTYIIAFGQFFQNIQIVRDDATGAETQRFTVPIEYGPKEKWDYRLKQDPNFERGVAVVLPRMSYQMTGINYDSSRKLPTLDRLIKPVSTGRRNTIYVPTPYSLKFMLSILTRNQSDGFQIVEQILPYFTPDLTFALQTIPEMGIVDQIPLILDSVTEEDTYDQSDFETQRLITWNLGFDMKAYFYGPKRSSSTVQEVIVNLYQSGIEGISDFDVLVDETGVAFDLEDDSGLLIEEDTANAMVDAQMATTIDAFVDPAVTITTEQVAGGISSYSLYRMTIVNDGAVAYWRLGETTGTVAADETSKFPGTYQDGAILGQPGALADGNFAMGCSGAAAPMVTFPSTSTMGVGVSSVTVEFWLNYTARTNSGDSIINANVAVSSGFEFSIVNELGGYSGFLTIDDTLKEQVVSVLTATHFSTDTWYHIVSVLDRDLSALLLYINGTLAAQSSIPTTYGSIMSPTILEAGLSMVGLLDEIAIYGHALTPEQIANHYALRTWKP